MAFSRGGGKQGFFSIRSKKRKGRKKTKETNQNINNNSNEGLGPSEVALRATSPDP